MPKISDPRIPLVEQIYPNDLLLLLSVSNAKTMKVLASNASYRPATKVIAPINSGVFADYYTDGIADDIEINQAFTSLAGGMGTVFLLTGTYNINPNQIIVPINASLRGEGYGTVLQLQSPGELLSLVSDTTKPGGFTLYNTITDIRFEGKTFDNSIAIDCGQYGQEFNIKNCWFHNFGSIHSNNGSVCINAGGTNKKFQIIGNWFGGSQQGNTRGISLSATGDVQIIGNNFHDFYEAIHGNTEKTQIVGNDIYSGDLVNSIGINIGTAAGGLQTVNITGNTISNVWQGVHIGLANTVDGCGANISNNFFRNIGGNAVYLRGNHNTLIGNYCQEIAKTGLGNDSHGIIIADAQYVKILGNNCYNSHANMGYFIAPLDSVNGNITIMGNDAVGAHTQIIRTPAKPNMIVRNNSGFITENSGIATIVGGTTSIVVSHGLSNTTPTLKNISTTIGANPTNDPGNIWIDTITLTKFTIHCRNDPGISGLSLAWRAIVL